MKLDLDAKTLFNLYQHKLDWINRRLEPKTLEFYNETAEAWKHAKEIVFDWYQDMRCFVEGGIPDERECFDYNSKLIVAYKPYEIKNGDIVSKFPCCGILTYRDQKWPIYTDDYGCQDFIVMEDGYQIPVCNMAGCLDWYYELDKIIDKIYN